MSPDSYYKQLVYAEDQLANWAVKNLMRFYLGFKSQETRVHGSLIETEFMILEPGI